MGPIEVPPHPEGSPQPGPDNGGEGIGDIDINLLLAIGKPSGEAGGAAEGTAVYGVVPAQEGIGPIEFPPHPGGPPQPGPDNGGEGIGDIDINLLLAIGKPSGEAGGAAEGTAVYGVVPAQEGMGPIESRRILVVRLSLGRTMAARASVTSTSTCFSR